MFRRSAAAATTTNAARLAGGRRLFASSASSTVGACGRWLALGAAGAAVGAGTALLLRGDATDEQNRLVHAASVPIGGGGGANSGVLSNQQVPDDGLCSMVAGAKSADELAQAMAIPARQAAINAAGAAGVTPLMLAAYQGNADFVRVLLDSGADTDIDSKVCRSSSHWTRYFPQYQPIGKGFRAFDFAILGGHPDVIALLVERGKCDPSLPRPLLQPKGANGRLSGGGAGGNAAAQGESTSMITPEDLIDRCHLVHSAPNFDAKEQQRALLLSAVKRGRQLRDDRVKRHRQQFPLEARLEEKLVGQQNAIQAVSSAIRRKENGWVDEDSPLVMLFMGSSGIGKTRTAKEIGAYLHDNGSGSAEDRKEMLSNCFIRVDMSEFQHKHEVSKFIGAPPGYVGYESGGQLVSKLEKCPNAVVLLDEVEKAHPDVLTVMLQAFDEGRLTDGQGKTIDCSDATFVLTSNLAQQEIADEAVRLRRVAAKTAARADETSSGVKAVLDGSVDPLTKNFKRNVVQPILRRHFGRDEFLGRINETLFFLPFTDEEQCQLARMELEAWKRRAEKKLNIELTWSPEVEAIAAEEYDLRYGARSIKYEIDRMCIAPIARAQEQGVVAPGCKVHIDIDWEVIDRIRSAAVKGDETRLQEQSAKLKQALEESVAPALPSDFGIKKGDSAAAAQSKRDRMVAAVEREQRKKLGLPPAGEDDEDEAESKRRMLVGPPNGKAEAPKPRHGTQLYRSGKVALHVGKAAEQNHGSSGLKRFFGFGGGKQQQHQEQQQQQHDDSPPRPASGTPVKM
jgi:ATP-dependent Clp protease ATP-binding subunit ClpB